MANPELAAEHADQSLQVLDPGVTRRPDIIDLFLEDGRLQLDVLIGARDAAARRGAAHRLLGSALALGLPRLAKACGAARHLVDASSEDIAIQSIRAEFDRAVRALSQSEDAGAPLEIPSPRVADAVREVLVVDGSPVARMVMARTIETLSETVRTAGTCSAATALLASHPSIGLVITGSLLPDGDGPSLLASLRRGDAPGPLGLLVTARPSASLERRARDCGAIGILPKPATASDVIEAIERHVASADSGNA